MMLQVMAYALMVSAALTIAAHCLERTCGLYRRPRRMPWIAAMILSIAVPLLMVFTARAPAASAGPVAAKTQVTTSAPREPIWKVAAPSDGQVMGMWTAASLAFGLYLVGASCLIRLRASRWQRRNVHGVDVLVSEGTGPALLGVWRPRMVIPQWLLSEPAATQRLILEHERQHLAARDPQMMLAGLLIIVSVPWNPFLWWQWRCMRHAMEADCDARVLRKGAEAGEYASVLLEATLRAARVFPGALAMSEPVTALERRIALLTPHTARLRLLQTACLVGLAAFGASVSLALDAPAISMRAGNGASLSSAQPPGEARPRPTPESVIADNDLDKDGVVTRDEATRLNGNLAVMWTVYDTDHDDRIDVAEFARVAQDMRVGAALENINGDRGGHRAPTRPEIIISINDHDGNGIVTREEANQTGKALMRMWDSFDLDKDGRVDAVEVGKAQGRPSPQP